MPTTSDHPEDLIALSLVPGAGRKTLHTARRFAARLGRPLSTFFEKPLAELLTLMAPGESIAAEALCGCGTTEIERARWNLALAREHGICVCTVDEPEYPAFIAESLGDQAPLVLFYRGNEALLHTRGAGIVGTRRPTQEGTGHAVDAAQAFAREGIHVVSGGARGIDQAAHQAALKAGGNTLVVLPEGIHACELPPFLRNGLQRGQVLLVSEFLPTDAWQTHRAMTRNRTIAACSTLVCVVEPGEKGGSMYTARQALAQGKPVFYWGGACRDGALRGELGAWPLTRAGKTVTSALLHAMARTEALPLQKDLFTP
jgi:DNA processing protein